MLCVWEYLRKIVGFWEKNSKLKQQHCKSFETLKTAGYDVELEFFSFIAGFLEPYDICLYQTDRSMIPFMYNYVYRMMSDLLKLFIEPDVIYVFKRGFDLISVDIHKKKNLKEVVIEYSA